VKSAHARRFWNVVLLIGIPLLFALGSGIWADRLLTIDPVPSNATSGIGFDVSDSPELDQISAVGSWASPMAASHATEIDVTVSGCQKAEVHAGFRLDERWYLDAIASELHRRFRARLPGIPNDGYSAMNPGTLEFVLSGNVDKRDIAIRLLDEQIPFKVTHPRGTGLTRVGARLPLSLSKGVSSVGVADPKYGIGPPLYLTFRAPWVFSRGYRTCYVLLPGLTDHYVNWGAGRAEDVSGTPIYVPANPYDAPLGAKGLDVRMQSPDQALGPIEGSNSVSVTNGILRQDESMPAPSSPSLGVSTWSCSRKPLPRSLTSTFSPECSAELIVDEPNRDANLQLRLLIAGTLISGGLIGAAAGARHLFFHVG
jgi:hypothetical protein